MRFSFNIARNSINIDFFCDWKSAFSNAREIQRLLLLLLLLLQRQQRWHSLWWIALGNCSGIQINNKNVFRNLPSSLRVLRTQLEAWCSSDAIFLRCLFSWMFHVPSKFLFQNIRNTNRESCQPVGNQSTTYATFLRTAVSGKIRLLFCSVCPIVCHNTLRFDWALANVEAMSRCIFHSACILQKRSDFSYDDDSHAISTMKHFNRNYIKKNFHNFMVQTANK